MDLFIRNFERRVYIGAMATEWDRAVAIHNLFAPNWNDTPTGSKVSLVVDCEIHTGEMMVGTSVPDLTKVRIFGDIGRQVVGCRRLTLLDVLLDLSKGWVDLLLTDLSVVVAHGLRPATDALRFVELCSGIACSGVGLSSVGFRHPCQCRVEAAAC